MPKAIFHTRPNSDYRDVPELRYHFPRRYLATVERILGDTIIYYEPTRTGPGQHDMQLRFAV